MTACTACVCAMELNFNEEIACKRQNHSFLSYKYTSLALQQTLQTKKKRTLKIVRLTSQKPTISIRFYLLQVYLSVPIFLYVVLLVPSINVLSDYFCSTQFGVSSYWLNSKSDSWHSSFKPFPLFIFFFLLHDLRIQINPLPFSLSPPHLVRCLLPGRGRLLLLSGGGGASLRPKRVPFSGLRYI